MSKGKLLHVQKLTGIAGSEGFLLNLGRGLSRRGWDCHFGLIEETSDPVDKAYEHLDDAGWSVNRFPYRKGILLELIPSLRRYIKQQNPDLINSHLLHGDLLVALASIGLNFPLITTKHNDDRFKYFPFYKYYARTLNFFFQQGITISDHLREFYEETLGVKSLPFDTIHYGLNPEPFDSLTNSQTDSEHINQDKVTFGMVARLVKQKGHSTLLKAFRSVIESHDSAELIIVGDGPLEGDLIKQRDTLDLNDHVQFLGRRSDIPELMNTFDCFVHPSRWEGFGLVFLEAMASRLPVIATNVSAIPEIVKDDQTGLLVPPDNIGALSDAMINLIENPEIREEYGKKGYERLRKKFSEEKMIQEYDNYYEKLIN